MKALRQAPSPSALIWKWTNNLEETRQKLEESLFYLGMIQPVPTPTYKQIADQNWMEAWKQNYKPILIGQRFADSPRLA